MKDSTAQNDLFDQHLQRRAASGSCGIPPPQPLIGSMVPCLVTEASIHGVRFLLDSFTYFFLQV